MAFPSREATPVASLEGVVSFGARSRPRSCKDRADLILINFSSLQLFNFDRALASVARPLAIVFPAQAHQRSPLAARVPASRGLDDSALTPSGDAALSILLDDVFAGLEIMGGNVRVLDLFFWPNTCSF